MSFSKSYSIYTIWHSTRTLEEFIELLKLNNIEVLIDVRSFPWSHKFPQFNKENLEKSMVEESIAYIHLSELGWRRKVLKNSHNTLWRHTAFRWYADYMETNEFKIGIESLKKIVTTSNNVAIMCSEAVWRRCHRSMISDYLKSYWWTIVHILSNKKIEKHQYTQPARIVRWKLLYSPKGKKEIDTSN